MQLRKHTLTFTVTAPAEVSENEIERAINSALDEPPCDWGDWEVELATITDVSRVERAEQDQ